MRCGSYDSASSSARSLSILSLINDKGVRRILSLFGVPHKSFLFPKDKCSPPSVPVLCSPVTAWTEDGRRISNSFPSLGGRGKGRGSARKFTSDMKGSSEVFPSPFGRPVHPELCRRDDLNFPLPWWEGLGEGGTPTPGKILPF